ncbi:MAG TPA: alkaline phosphatase family protein, partial [Streptosporangiaceae bacterium]
MDGSGISRRSFIGGSASAVAVGALAPEGLRGLGQKRSKLRQPGSRPFPGLPAGSDTMPRIQHIVVLMLENHSFDNFFGMLGRGDGF